MLFKVVLLLGVVGITLAGPFAQCDEGAKPVSMQVENCNEEYCEVHRGKASAMKLSFKTIAEAKKLKASLKAQIGNHWLPWSLGKQANVCNHLSNGKCPIPANTEAIYSLDVTIPGIAPPGTRTVIKLAIHDQDAAIVTCVQFPVLVVA